MNFSKYSIDDGMAFYLSQLSSLESTVYEAKYADITYQKYIPLATNVNEYSTVWNYISYDGVTSGKFVGSNADDLPQVSSNASLSTVQLGYAGNSYSYSLDELRIAQAMNMPLDTTYASLSRRGAMEHSQTVAYFGDAQRKMSGLFNNAAVPLTNSTVNWATASSQEIVEDMNSLFIEVWKDSATSHLPNVLLLDSERYAQISSQRMGSNTDTTILTFFLENNYYTNRTGLTPTVDPLLQLNADVLSENGVDNGGKARMVAYELNSENLAIANPIPWRPLPPQPKGLKIEVPCEYKISGTEVRFLKSMKYKDAV